MCVRARVPLMMMMIMAKREKGEVGRQNCQVWPIVRM